VCRRLWTVVEVGELPGADAAPRRRRLAVLLSTIAMSVASAAIGATIGRRLEALDDSLWDGGEDADADLPRRRGLSVGQLPS
jgi:hypothetical protein